MIERPEKVFYLGYLTSKDRYYIIVSTMRLDSATVEKEYREYTRHLLLWLFALFFFPVQAAADSWLPPRRLDVFSSTGAFSFTILPREIANPSSYFKDLDSGTEPQNAGQLKEGRTSCAGILWKKTKNGHYTQSWSRTLVNNVSPTSALVSKSGDYVVTFDNWHAKGYGKDAVVIYGPGGKLVRELALNDIMSEAEVEALPRSVSSIWWGQEHHFDADEKVLVLRIVSNGKMPYEKGAEFRKIRIKLDTGTVMTPVVKKKKP